MVDSSSPRFVNVQLPKEVVDPHHHFLLSPAGTFLAGLGAPSYSPKQYHCDVVQDLDSVGVKLAASVHVEAIPDVGKEDEEVKWVQGLVSDGSAPTVSGIVAACDVAASEKAFKTSLDKLRKASKLVKGVRWIVDVGASLDAEATHVAVNK